MNISEIEKITGISKQAIRFYEKEGLISPKRNQDNQYREYDENDVKTLKMIYVFRKVGLSLDEISKVLKDYFNRLDCVAIPGIILLFFSVNILCAFVFIRHRGIQGVKISGRFQCRHADRRAGYRGAFR